MSKTIGRDQNGRKRVEATESAEIESAETESAEIESAETKRLAARRRFLLGGAAAVPAIVTLGQKQAWAASAAVCQSMGLGFGDGFSHKDYYRAVKKELAASVFCRQ